LGHWLWFVLHLGLLRGNGERHAVDPALPAVGAEDEPVGAVALQQLDLVALVDDADLRRAELIRRVEEADQAVADATPFEVLEGQDAGRLERQTWGRGVGTQRICPAHLLQRRPPPARDHGIVRGGQSGSGLGFEAAGGRRRNQVLVRLALVSTPLAEERERGPRHGPRARRGEAREQASQHLLERSASARV